MVMERERIPAAVVLIIFLIGAVIVYLVLLPVPTGSQLAGLNFPSSNGQSPPPPTQVSGFNYYFNSYIGGNQNQQNLTYPVGTFALRFSQTNSTASITQPFTLTSSWFGSSSYTLQFNGTSSDTYYMILNINSVSGSPRMKLSLNGNYFYDALPSSGVIIMKLSGVTTGRNSLQIYNNLNGFAFSESMTFSGASIVQQSTLNGSESSSVKVVTFEGLGNYFLQFTPIGTGTLDVTVHGTQVASITGTNDAQTTVRIPYSVINSMIGAGSVPSLLTLDFGLGFNVASNSSYVVANSQLVYETPSVTEENVTLPFTVQALSKGVYTIIFYVTNVIKIGNVTFTVEPSGQTFSIPSSALISGENILLEPAAMFAGNSVNGNYTGTITVTSPNGLVIPAYLSISKS